jgi:uncharacterized membrane protein YfcA
VPRLGTAPRLIAAALCAIIGGVAGLLGIGGGELRLPVLVSYLALSVRVAVAVNLAVGIATVTTSLIRRWDSGALDDVQGWGVLIAFLTVGNVLGAAVGVFSAHRAHVERLRTAMRLYLLAIGALLLYEAFFHFPHADLDPDATASLAVAVACGLAIGWVASVFGVAGGELRIPLLIFVFGAPIKVAGTLSTIASLPTVALAFAGYARRGHIRTASTYTLILALSAASVVGATVGVALLPSVSDSILRVLLGTVLIASAWRLDDRDPGFANQFAKPS